MWTLERDNEQVDSSIPLAGSAQSHSVLWARHFTHLTPSVWEDRQEKIDRRCSVGLYFVFDFHMAQKHGVLSEMCLKITLLKNQDTWDGACVKLGKSIVLEKSTGARDEGLRTKTVLGKLGRLVTMSAH